ncbi:MAG TPA: hypothetical protein VNS79_08275 [Sphingobium sp.]|nr:hypothetical protein [Sphingobium sp.]
MLIGKLTLAMGTAVTIASMTASAPAAAQGSLADQLAVCARIAKKSARTACYDSIPSGQQQGGLSSGSSDFGAASIRTPAPAPAAPPAPAAAPAAAAASGFGAEHVQRAAPQRQANAEASEVEVAVQSVSDNGLNMWQINLTDGAVWRMTERAAAGFRPPAPNETVTIRKGALGSYLMNVGRQGSVRVTRIR